LQLFKGTIRLKAIVTGSSGDFFNISHLAVPMQALISAFRLNFDREPSRGAPAGAPKPLAGIIIYHIALGLSMAAILPTNRIQPNPERQPVTAKCASGGCISHQQKYRKTTTYNTQP
jgi:hypothetical protein